MRELSTLMTMQTADDQYKLDPRGKVGTQDIHAWMLIGYRLFMRLVMEQRYYSPNMTVLPLNDDARTLQVIDEIERGIWEGPIPELALIDIPTSGISAEKIGRRIYESQRLSKMAIILISSSLLNSQQEERLKLRTHADSVMYEPLPTPMDFRMLVTQIILSKS